jgi:predicted nucleic acid-binding protein
MQRIAISPVAYLEEVSGTANKSELRNANKFLSGFSMLYYEHADQQWAMEQARTFLHSHGVGYADCLIAAPCVRLQLPL